MRAWSSVSCQEILYSFSCEPIFISVLIFRIKKSQGFFPSNILWSLVWLSKDSANVAEIFVVFRVQVSPFVLFAYLFVCIIDVHRQMYTHMPWHACGVQRTMCGRQFPPSPLCVFGLNSNHQPWLQVSMCCPILLPWWTIIKSGTCQRNGGNEKSREHPSIELRNPFRVLSSVTLQCLRL